MIIDQIGVRRLLSQGLKRVPNASRHEDRGFGPHLGGKTATKAIAGPQVHPGAENPTRRQRHKLVPRLGVDAAGRADVVVERHVVLYRRKVWQAELDHLLALPVLLKPAPIVASDIERDYK